MGSVSSPQHQFLYCKSLDILVVFFTLVLFHIKKYHINKIRHLCNFMFYILDFIRIQLIVLQFSTFIACVICKVDFTSDDTNTIRASNCQHGKCSMIKFEIDSENVYFVYVFTNETKLIYA